METLNKNNMLSEDDLWKTVESLNWNKDHDYERIIKICQNLNNDHFKQLENFVDNKMDDLYNKFEKDWLGHPGISCGDDSWMDLRAEVIGRGKEFFNSITSDKLRKMANENDYEECFLYCFQINQLDE